MCFWIVAYLTVLELGWMLDYDQLWRLALYGLYNVIFGKILYN